MAFLIFPEVPVMGAAGVQSGEDNVVILLDGSGSMRHNMSGSAQTRMNTARTALRKVLESINPSTRIGLLVFNSRLQDKWVHPLGPLDRNSLLKSLDMIGPLGGTPLGEYLEKAANSLLEAREKSLGYGTFRMIVVTDGEADDPNAVDRIVPLIMGRGLTMDVIGVDMKQNHTLATKVNSYRRADDPNALTKALGEVFAEVQSGLGGDGTGHDFSVLMPIGVEMAAGMIQALDSSGNSPVSASGRNNTAAVPTRTPTTQSRPGSRKSSPAVSGETSGYGLLFIVIMILLSLPSKKKVKNDSHRG